jgi:hypothetical protein
LTVSAVVGEIGVAKDGILVYNRYQKKRFSAFGKEDRRKEK